MQWATMLGQIIVGQNPKTNANITLLALFVGQRQCINFYISRVNFLTTLCSHLDVTCSWYFRSILLNVDVNYSVIYIYI